MKVLLLVFPLLLSSCFKTAEEIKREQRIDQQINQSSKIIAELSSQINELKGGLASTSGQLEEMGHNSKQTRAQEIQSIQESLEQLKEQMKILSEENTQTQNDVKNLRAELKSQKAFIQKVTGTLSKISGTPQKSEDTLAMAHKAFEANKQKKAKELYLQVLAEDKVNNAVKNHVFYNLGLLNYWSKKYDDALVYFSKIYTKYPKSSFAPASLLYIGRSFKNQNKTDEAKATFEELIKNYPKSRHAKSAQKELKS